MAWAATFDPFEALGLERNATPKSIKAQYYELARRYHPNRNQGSDESKTALSEHFYHVNQAWKLLCEADKRRRCIELLQLLDQQETVFTNCAELFDTTEQGQQQSDRKSSLHEGHVSSDADEDDEDLPRAVGVRRRETFDKPAKRSPSGRGGLEDIAEGSEAMSPSSARGRSEKLRFQKLKSSGRSGKEDSSSDNNTAAERRRRMDKLRRKELDAFVKYRDAMVDKFDAEAVAERYREQFEQAKWRREYFERAPKETTQRVRLTQLMSTAIKALMTQKPIKPRRKGSVAGIPNSALTPIEPTETNQFLNLPSRTKTIHRRGYSSDISGDQTSSSEEGSSDKQTSPSRSPGIHSRSGPRKHRRLDSGPSLPPLPIPQHCLPNGKHDPISPITGPGPKLLIRAPTTLGEMFDAQGSDVDTASASSRSPSPQPQPRNEPDKFVLVHTEGASDVFGTEQDRRARSASADRRAASRNGSTSASRQPATDTCIFRIKQIGTLHHRHIPMENVHELTYAEKQWMLGVEPDTGMDPAALLDAVSSLDQNLSKLLMVKPDIKELFNFRLIYSHREVVKQQHQTFIALSYRRKLHVEKKEHKNHRYYTLPLEQEIFQAVWDERLSDTEGVWIDQICIDGNSEQERTISMSAMDMVYRSARLVVVALDDVQLEAHEGSILENHMREFEALGHVPARKRFTRRPQAYLEANEDLFGVIRKLMRSSWFRRAWCRHEMRLAREHIFLVPCRTRSGKSVLRFTGKCLTHLLSLATEVPFELEIEAVKPALYAFFRDRSKLAEHDHRLQMHHGNFTTVVAEVFAMEAGGDPRIPEERRAADARKDKISIILNTMECGLALHPRTRSTSITLPTHECNYMLLLLALAARDPGALGSVGLPFRQLPYDLASSWLFEPTNVDSGLNNYRTLNRLPEHSKITTHCQDGEHFVQLGLKFLGEDLAVKPRDTPETVTIAQHFMDVCEKRSLGRNRKRYLLENKTANVLFGSMREVYVETLVCVLECGPEWMSDVCQRYGVGRWRHDLQPAYELLIALKNTGGKWPDTAWSNQATGFIMDFVNFMIIRGMPQRHITQPEKWRPVWVPTLGGGKLVTFAPSGGIRVAIPSALLDTDYNHLARMWILQPRGEPVKDERSHHHREWTLLGKSILFSDDIASDLLEQPSGMVHHGQKVFGRGAKSSKALQIPHPRRKL